MPRNVMVFVEDELNDAYEILVRKAMGLPLDINSGVRIRVVRVTQDELMDYNNLLDLSQRALRSGAQQVVFCMDHEGPGADPGRVQARRQFREAFQQLCDYIDGLPQSHSLKRIHLARVEVHSCLEAWLLSDPPAIARAAGDHSYMPSARQTHQLPPHQARQNIAHILNEVGRRRSKRHLRRISASAVRSWGHRIAREMDIVNARRYNFSLNYFCAMIETNRNGCEQTFPDPPE
ncbi:MAG TPA: hypothetical protein ENK35_04560 [Candidatus Tenderia sp.]|nr:hypothetical protein [Candidatus Tenderia sp.]